MRKTETLHIILEIVTILSNIVIGVTILTFMFQGVVPDKSYIGSIILAIGATEMVDFLALRDLTKRRNIPNAIVAGVSMVFGFVLLFLRIDLKMTCILWGAFSIAFQIAKISNAGFNLLKEPFHNGVIIILCIIELILSIFLIVKTEHSLNTHLIFVGISLLVESLMLIIEFVIHRYQK